MVGLEISYVEKWLVHVLWYDILVWYFGMLFWDVILGCYFGMLLWDVILGWNYDILEWNLSNQIKSKTVFFSQLKIIINFHPKIS